jgi:NitT/TauT family transport system substrate-binding protein
VNNRIVKGFVTIAVLGIAVSLSSSVLAEKEKIRIGWVYAMANAPIIIAKEKGYFEELGLDAEIRSFTSGPIVHQALAAGELDMAYIGSPPVYHWFSRGLESRILAKVNYGQAAVLVRKDSGISDLQGLKGKTMAGVKKGSGMDVLLRGFVLSEAGKLEPDKDVTIVSMPSGNMGPSVESKVVDGAFIWEPFTSQFEMRGDSKVIFDMNQAVPKYPWYIVMAMPDAIKNKRSAIKKVLAAHKKAVEFLNSSPTAGNDIIAREFKLESVKNETTGETITGEQIVAQARKRLGWEWDLTNKDMDFIQNLMNYSLSLGYINKPLKAGDLVDRSFVNEVAMRH